MVMAPTACLPAEICVSKHYQGKNDYHSQISNYGGDDAPLPKLAAKDLVLDILKKRVSDVDVDRCGPGEEDAFYVADMGEIYRQHLRWKMNLGRVKPFYGRSRRSSTRSKLQTPGC